MEHDSGEDRGGEGEARHIGGTQDPELGEESRRIDP